MPQPDTPPSSPCGNRRTISGEDAKHRGHLAHTSAWLPSSLLTHGGNRMTISPTRYFEYLVRLLRLSGLPPIGRAGALVRAELAQANRGCGALLQSHPVPPRGDRRAAAE